MFITGGAGSSHALDAAKTGVDGTGASIEEIANQIRRANQWRILDASPREDESGFQYFRFKLLNKKGRVKVINIDPTKPNLGRLE
ncbi:MAG: hypothetical protein GKR95_12095 [Gammaproteobacteria bacterium]|nr:hypothetical protein [Gammaproteobacteria bacterium]